MRKIIYYVASSIDGFIAGEDDDTSCFYTEGDCIEQYQYDLESMDTVIMGRRTYEFGYKYGLQPGQPAYPHMEHFIFSDHLHLDNLHEQVRIEKMDIDRVKALKSEIGSDIYLCGGGDFAGWLLAHGMIDELKLKLNPVVLGDGVPLFGKAQVNAKFDLKYHKRYPDGMQMITYDVSI